MEIKLSTYKLAGTTVVTSNPSFFSLISKRILEYYIPEKNKQNIWQFFSKLDSGYHNF